MQGLVPARCSVLRLHNKVPLCTAVHHAAVQWSGPSWLAGTRKSMSCLTCAMGICRQQILTRAARPPNPSQGDGSVSAGR